MTGSIEGAGGSQWREAPGHGRGVAIILACLAAACAGGNGDAGGAERPANAPVDEPGGGPMASIEATVTTGRDTYAPGEPIELGLVTRNPADGPVTLHFTSSQRYDFRIERPSGETAWTWSAARGFLQVLGSETIEPGGELRWTETADVELAPGTYTVVGMVTNRDGPVTDRTEITVR